MAILDTYDVIVAGGGPAGYPAAIQAARMGVRVLLVEKSGQLGGTTTLNRVAFPGLFHAWGRPIIGGIGWELVCRAVETGGGTLPDFSQAPARHWQQQIPLCPALLAALIDEEVQASGCHLLLHTLPAAVSRTDQGKWRVQLCGKEGLFAVESSWLIDATGDANLARLAGCPLQPAPAKLQPGTLAFCLAGYDSRSISIGDVDRAAAAELAAGRLQPGDFGWGGRSFGGLLHSRGKNSIHLPDIDAADSAGKTQAELRGRAALLRIYRFLKSRPGLESLRIDWIAPECGIRETRSILGRSTVTYEDYRSARVWPDAVCHSFYPIDLHTDEGLRYEMLEAGRVPTIPLSAMLPRGVEGFLAAGRCISGDRLAHSAFRVQASCMAMGQAAGAAAALATARNLSDAAVVPREELRLQLEKQGAIFPAAESELPADMALE